MEAQDDSWTKPSISVDPHSIPIRLRKFLAHNTYLTNAQIRELFDAGQIKLLVPREKGEKQDDKTDEATNYTPVDLTSTSNTLEHDLTTIVYPDEDLVYINGKLLTTGVNFKRVYIAFHKPVGYLSVWKGEEEIHRNLTDIIGNKLSEHEGLVPVGRLDKDTSGLLILTNDGDLNHAIRKKDNHILKMYVLTLREGNLSLEHPKVAKLLTGVDIFGGPAKAHSINIRSTSPQGTILELFISEGRKRVIRKMCFGVKLKLLHLHREKIGNIELKDLPSGDYRYLSEEEVNELWKSAGGLDTLYANRINALVRLINLYHSQGQKCERLEAWFHKHNLSYSHEVNPTKVSN